MLSQRWFSRLDAGAAHSLWQPLLTSDVWNDLSDEFAKARRASDAKSPEMAGIQKIYKRSTKGKSWGWSWMNEIIRFFMTCACPLLFSSFCWMYRIYQTTFMPNCTSWCLNSRFPKDFQPNPGCTLYNSNDIDNLIPFFFVGESSLPPKKRPSSSGILMSRSLCFGPMAEVMI